MKARQENALRKRGDRMPKTSFTYFMILLKTRLKMLNFVDIKHKHWPYKVGLWSHLCWHIKGHEEDLHQQFSTLSFHYSHLEGLLKQTVMSHPQGFKFGRFGWAQVFTFLTNYLTNAACYNHLISSRSFFSILLNFLHRQRSCHLW